MTIEARNTAPVPETGAQGFNASIHRLLSVAGVAVALVGGPVASAEAQEPVAAAQSPQLAKMHELPGSSIPLASSVREQLANSAITLQTLSKNAGGHVKGDSTCSGNKVNIDDRTYISTAKHCLKKFLEQATVGAAASQPVYDISPQVLNNILVRNPNPYITRTTKEFYTENNKKSWFLSSDVAQDPLRAIGSARTAVVSVNSDAALLQIDSKKDAKSLKSAKGIKSISFDPKAPAPIKGQPVGLYSTPGSNDGYPVKAKGTYIGQYTAPNLETYDVVTHNITYKRKDPCFFGASGSSFAVNVPVSKKSKSSKYRTYVSGPLSARNDPRDAVRQELYGAEKPTANEQTTRAQAIEQRRSALEAYTGVDTERDVICLFARTSTQTRRELINGVGKIPQPTQLGEAIRVP